jgi:hypothetical protein
VKGRDHLGDIGIARNMILNFILNFMDWIHLAQDRDQWQALVNMVMSLQAQ